MAEGILEEVWKWLKSPTPLLRPVPWFSQSFWRLSFEISRISLCGESESRARAMVWDLAIETDAEGCFVFPCVVDVVFESRLPDNAKRGLERKPLVVKRKAKGLIVIEDPSGRYGGASCREKCFENWTISVEYLDREWRSFRTQTVEWIQICWLGGNIWRGENWEMGSW